MQALAGHARNAAPKGVRAAFAKLRRVQAVHGHVVPLRPFRDVSLRHFCDARGGPVRKMQLLFEPESDGPREEIWAMARAGLKAEVEDVLLAAVKRDGPFAQVFKKGLAHFRDPDHAVFGPVENQRRASRRVQIVNSIAPVAAEADPSVRT